jgi:hypothetical protein
VGRAFILFCSLVSVSETPVIMCNYLSCWKLVLKDIEPTLGFLKKLYKICNIKREQFEYSEK